MKKKRVAEKVRLVPISPLQGQRQLEALNRLLDECDPKASAGPARPPSRHSWDVTPEGWVSNLRLEQHRPRQNNRIRAATDLGAVGTTIRPIAQGLGSGGSGTS